MTARASTQHLCTGESGEYGLQWSYQTDGPLETVLSPDYFMSVRARINVGDHIRCTSVRDGRAQETCELLVVEKRPGAVETIVTREVLTVPPSTLVEQPREEMPAERYVTSDGKPMWNPGRKMFEVKVRGETVAAVRDRELAYQIAGGHVPLPPHEEQAADGIGSAA